MHIFVYFPLSEIVFSLRGRLDFGHVFDEVFGRGGGLEFLEEFSVDFPVFSPRSISHLTSINSFGKNTLRKLTIQSATFVEDACFLGLVLRLENLEELTFCSTVILPSAYDNNHDQNHDNDGTEDDTDNTNDNKMIF